jgi:hypothetical protein
MDGSIEQTAGGCAQTATDRVMHSIMQTLTIVHVAAKGDGAVDALVGSVARIPPRLELRESTVNRVAGSGKRQGAVTSGVPHQPG